MTMKEVAQLAGVSVATVSNVITGKKYVNPELVAKVRSTMEAVNYIPNASARSLRVKQTSQIAVILPDTSVQFYGLVLKSIEKFAYSRGYSVCIGNDNYDYAREIELIESFIGANVDGIINIAALFRKRDVPKLAGKPMVMVQRLEFPDSKDAPEGRCSNIGFIGTDNWAGMEMTMALCCKTAKSKFMYLGGSGQMQYPNASMRIECFHAYLKKVGVPRERISWYECGFSFNDGYERMRKLLEEGLDVRDTAIACSNDDSAWGVIEALREYGLRVPEDVAVIGCDDIDYAAHITPPLSTVHNDHVQLGTGAAKMLLDYLADSAKGLNERCITIMPHLVTRKSMVEGV